jgi:hypothetical protein
MVIAYVLFALFWYFVVLRVIERYLSRRMREKPRRARVLAQEVRNPKLR